MKPINIFVLLLLVLKSRQEDQTANKKVAEPLAEVLDEDGGEISESLNEELYRRGGHGRYRGHGYGHRYPGHRVGEAPPHPGILRTKVTVQRRIIRPVSRSGIPLAPADPVSTSVLVGAARPRLDVLPDYDVGIGAEVGLPKCSYINTDFFGDDVGDGRGLTTGSPYACKRACIDESRCAFWTFRRGWARDCYLKRGDGRGDLTPVNVTPRPGFVSGTVGSRCRCLRNGGDEICPVRRSGGVGFPWRRRNVGPRFQYDDIDYRIDYEDFDDDDDDPDREVVVLRDDDRVDGDNDGDNGGRRSRGRRRRNRNRNGDSDNLRV